MKKLSLILAAFFVAALLCPIIAAADGPGEGNIDGGGGGDLEGGTGDSYWSTGNEGVRVTVVRDGTPVTTPFDFSKRCPPNISIHFGNRSKMYYRSGGLSPTTSAYQYFQPASGMPTIISTSSGGANIEDIKRYFCSEYCLMRIAEITGMNYDVLINGEYRIVLEPVAYFTYNGTLMAMTATEAALYDQTTNGHLRSTMGNLTHRNLPLAIFLETADMGYPAWSGSKTDFVTNEQIKSSLGIGIVWFKDPPEEEDPALETIDYVYRVDTDVVTSVYVSGGQSDPDHENTVNFSILGSNYSAGNVYYPSGDGQLAWVRWHTPDEEMTFTINVTVSGPGSPVQGTINVKIEDLDKNPPPNPVADDRNDSFSPASIPSKDEVLTNAWGVWVPWWQEYWVKCWHGSGDDEWYHWVDEGWWEFDWYDYKAELSATMTIKPDDKSPTASGNAMKSGYGVNQTVTASVWTNMASAVTEPQNAVSYFPEFRYETYWRLLDRMGGGSFAFKENVYSTYKNRTHFTPIWMPDGTYTVYTWQIDCWTPAGMLSQNLTDSVTISGNLWSDWHIAPLFP